MSSLRFPRYERGKSTDKSKIFYYMCATWGIPSENLTNFSIFRLLTQKNDTEEFNKYYFHSPMDFQRNFYVLKATLYFCCLCGLDMKLWLIFWNVFLSLICSEIINFIFCALLWLAIQAVDRNVRKIKWLSFKRQIKARESYKLANLPWKWLNER